MRLALGSAVLAFAVLTTGLPRVAGATMLVADPGSLRQRSLPAVLILADGETLPTFDAVRALAARRPGAPVVYDFSTGRVEPYRPAADQRFARARPDTVLVWEPARGRLRPIRSMTEQVSALVSQPGRFVVLTDVARGSLEARVAETGPRTAALLAASSCGLCPACTFADTDEDGVTACDDCNDGNPAVRPGALEFCNAVDDDCNGLIDADDPSLQGCGDDVFCNGIEACGGGSCLIIDACAPTEFGCASYDGSCDEETGCFLILNQDLCPPGTACTETGECVPLGTTTTTEPMVPTTTTSLPPACPDGEPDPGEDCGEPGLSDCVGDQLCVACHCRARADCDLDGGVDLLDVLTQIDFALGRFTPTPAQAVLCSNDCDADVDLFDMLIGVDVVLLRRPLPLVCP